MKRVRIASGSAYWGDALDPAVYVVNNGDINYIGFDHLAELTLAVFQRVRQQDPTKGYIEDIVPWMEAILPIARPKGVKVLSNAGGANPEAAGDAVAQVAKRLGMSGLKIGVVTGDDILAQLDELRREGITLPNSDTGEKDIDRIRDKIVAANAYIGADQIIECLKMGAEVIVTGRVSDNALYVAPLMYEFGWQYDDQHWDKIGQAITVGHIIECSCMCCGGASNQWQVIDEMWRPGFPIAEFYENGEAVITKALGTGGLVNEWTVKEHLVYEVQDPKNYIMPDGIADFTTVRVEDCGQNQVKLTNMTGKTRPDKLKVCIGYHDGFIAEGMCFYPWPDAYGKAKTAANIFLKRLQVVDCKYDDVRIDYMGVNMLHGKAAPEPEYELNEVGVRMAVKTKNREDAEKARREATHLWTFGPIGSSFGSPLPIRPVLSLWPTFVPREKVKTRSVILEV